MLSKEKKKYTEGLVKGACVENGFPLRVMPSISKYFYLILNVPVCSSLNLPEKICFMCFSYITLKVGQKV